MDAPIYYLTISGGTFLLFWNAIQEAKQNKLRIFDLGRSDCHNNGLITFKNLTGRDIVGPELLETLLGSPRPRRV